MRSSKADIIAMHQCFRYGSRFILLLAFACAPPLTFDPQGIAHGSGQRTYEYHTGAIKLLEVYKDGQLVRSSWFKPDGTLIRETDWISGTGEGIYLREDGSIRSRVQYVSGVAEGQSTEYDESGKATKVFYRHGQRIAQQAVTTEP
jgi:antitoxin component YwqK of YwqJK toxin-antitoxin module